ncbi:MAG: Ig-like domain-containing protein [bacterium]
MKKKFFALIFGLGLMAFPLSVLAIPAFPMNFYGAITINGDNAPVGTVVNVYKGAIANSTTLLSTVTTTTAGTYGSADRTVAESYTLNVPDYSGYDTLTFKVNCPQYDNNAQLSSAQTHSGVFVEFTGVSKDLAFTGATATALVSIDVTPVSASISAGNTRQFTATGSYINSTTSDITSSATWSSASSSVAAISTGGLATGVSAGTSVITASYTDAVNGVLTDTATLTVTAASSGGGSSAGSSVAPATATTTTTTTGTASGAITASKGGTVATTVGYTRAQAAIPADALSASGVVSVESVAKSNVAAPTAGSGSFLIGGLIFDFKVDGKTATFKKPVTLTFTYSDLQVEGLNENLLTVFRLNTTNNTWEALNTTVDTVTNTITTSVDHFTVFAIMTSTGEKVILAPTKDASLAQMTLDAQTVMTGDVNQVIAAMGVKRDLTAEVNYNTSIIAKIIEGAGITAEARNTINNFVTYGTASTKKLGAGERGGVVNSFRAAFGKLPATVEDWNDVIKIGNGRWPTQRSADADALATTSFKKIYLRDSNRTNPHDDAAVTVMAYGLRPANRNLASEKAAINIFKNIYKYAPTSAMEWDIVRAIAYSGAVR